MDNNRVDIATAAAQMGITPEAARKRIARGSLDAVKEDGRWYITTNGHVQDNEHHVQDSVQDRPDNRPDDRPDSKDKLIEVLTEELEARRREVQELHVLLQTAQAALVAPKEGIKTAWWKFWT